MREHEVHIVTHLLFMATATLMWWPVMSPLAELPRLPYGLGMLYLFLVGIPMQVVAALITTSDQVLYPWYSVAPRTWGLSPLDDQQLGGLLMWVPGNIYMFLAHRGAVSSCGRGRAKAGKGKGEGRRRARIAPGVPRYRPFPCRLPLSPTTIAAAIVVSYPSRRVPQQPAGGGALALDLLQLQRLEIEGLRRQRGVPGELVLDRAGVLDQPAGRRDHAQADQPADQRPVPVDPAACRPRRAADTARRRTARSWRRSAPRRGPPPRRAAPTPAPPSSSRTAGRRPGRPPPPGRRVPAPRRPPGAAPRPPR